MAVGVGVGNILEVKHYCRFAGQTGLNISHWEVTAIVNNGTGFAAICQAFSGNFSSAYKGWIVSTAVYEGVTVQNIFPLPIGDAGISRVGTGAGTSAGDALPSQAAAVLKLTTGLAGRKFRGRKYFPFAPESSNTQSDLSAPAQAQLFIFGVLFTSPIVVTEGASTTTVRPTIWHRGTSTHTPITDFVPRTKWGTQRRRSLITAGDAISPVG